MIASHNSSISSRSSQNTSNSRSKAPPCNQVGSSGSELLPLTALAAAEAAAAAVAADATLQIKCASLLGPLRGLQQAFTCPVRAVRALCLPFYLIFNHLHAPCGHQCTGGPLNITTLVNPQPHYLRNQPSGGARGAHSSAGTLQPLGAPITVMGLLRPHAVAIS